MASTAKIMTALIVLEDHPLDPGATGPVLTITPADVANYRRDVGQGKSVVAVIAGEHLSEYQLLQGLLIPSANNFAELLAAWDAGSIPAFVTKMNARAAGLGMTGTRFVDSSGFDPGTVSTPTDLIRLASTAMHLPVFAGIVVQPQASLPVAGVVRNIDILLGQEGILGVKTGHTDQAGGNFVFAADLFDENQLGIFRVYGAVMGQASLDGAFGVTTRILQDLRGRLHVAFVQHRLAPVATAKTAWGESTTVHPDDFWLVPYIDGMTLTRRIHLDQVTSPMTAGSRVGSMELTLGSRRVLLPLVLSGPLDEPPLSWRLTRPPG
jgi:D-alanyl-D-alanine carboxypeptidase (penicillin-binding protein 5/6)